MSQSIPLLWLDRKMKELPLCLRSTRFLSLLSVILLPYNKYYFLRKEICFIPCVYFCAPGLLSFKRLNFKVLSFAWDCLYFTWLGMEILSRCWIFFSGVVDYMFCYHITPKGILNLFFHMTLNNNSLMHNIIIFNWIF